MKKTIQNPKIGSHCVKNARCVMIDEPSDPSQVVATDREPLVPLADVIRTRRERVEGITDALEILARKIEL